MKEKFWWRKLADFNFQTALLVRSLPIIIRKNLSGTLLSNIGFLCLRCFDWKQTKELEERMKDKFGCKKNLSTWISALHCAFFQIVIKTLLGLSSSNIRFLLAWTFYWKQTKERKRNERQILMQKLANFNISMILLLRCLPIVIRQNLLGML